MSIKPRGYKFTVRVLAALVAVAVMATAAGWACTSMIVGRRASANGHCLLWKNRDTGNQHNFVQNVPAKDGNFAYVALYNAGDSTLSEAWMGMNQAGFAIMNTASYNLAPDTAVFKDREGVVMSRALQVCRTVDDFARLLDTLPKPMGVQANFGVIDADGNGAYFETDDYRYTPYYLKDTDNDVLIRTNYSFSGNDADGMGYIRYDNTCHLLKDKIEGGGFDPEDFTEGVSRSFYHSLYDKDIAADTTLHWAVDQDFVPRRITSASVVIEGVSAGEDPAQAVMWTLMGYPPCGHTQAVFVDSVPAGLRPTLPGWRSADSEKSLQLRAKAFPRHRGSGDRYIDMDFVRLQQAAQRQQSLQGYSVGRRERARRQLK